MRTAVIDYHGVPLCCEFSYYAGFAGSQIDPPEPPMAELSSVKAGAVDILSVLNEEQMDEISDLCLQDIADAKEAAMELRAERERDYSGEPT
jgi:nitrogen regulatory protein PII-like uncharacterized protein